MCTRLFFHQCGIRVLVRSMNIESSMSIIKFKDLVLIQFVCSIRLPAGKRLQVASWVIDL